MCSDAIFIPHFFERCFSVSDFSLLIFVNSAVDHTGFFHRLHCSPVILNVHDNQTAVPVFGYEDRTVFFSTFPFDFDSVL